MRILKSCIMLLALASCGFRPLYEKKHYNDLDESTARIAISPVKGYDGVHGVSLRNNLLNKLTPHGKPSNPKYTLDIRMDEPIITDYTIKNDGTASSYLVTINAHYKLIENFSRGEALSKTATSNISYNILKDQYSTEMLKNNAIKLAIESISDDIYFSVITFLTER